MGGINLVINSFLEEIIRASFYVFKVITISNYQKG